MLFSYVTFRMIPNSDLPTHKQVWNLAQETATAQISNFESQIPNYVHSLPWKPLTDIFVHVINLAEFRFVAHYAFQ